MNTGNAIRIPSILAVPLVAAYVIAFVLSTETIEIVIEDKSAGRHSQAVRQSPVPFITPGAAFLIYTPEEVFSVESTYIFLDFAAAERYHAMKVGQRYQVSVAGWRFPALHWYRNIVQVEEG